MRSLVVAVLFSNLILGTVEAQDLKARLASAPSEEEIVGFYGRFDAFGKAHRQRLDLDGRGFFAYWIVNKAGDIQFLWLFERKGKAWQLVIDYPDTASDLGAREVVWNLSEGRFQLVSQKGAVMAEYPKKEGDAARAPGEKP